MRIARGIPGRFSCSYRFFRTTQTEAMSENEPTEIGDYASVLRQIASEGELARGTYFVGRSN